MSPSNRKSAALELWKDGQEFHLTGHIEAAIELYSKSIETYPTAEAHTFRGWAYSFQGRITDAIDECKRAIEVDPTFGNPYNDIGSYLLKLGELDEAIGWLQKAKKAPRYGPRHFAYMNLGRVYAAQGLIFKAIEEFEAALEICPGEQTCLAALEGLRSALN